MPRQIPFTSTKFWQSIISLFHTNIKNNVIFEARKKAK